MILTITPNPSLDLLFESRTLVWDDANRTEAPRTRPGGQGINVTRAVRALGGSSVAVALLGGRVGTELERMLSAEGTPCEPVEIAGETRVFVGARETDTGRSLLLNPRGPRITPEEVERITEMLVAAIARVKPHWVAVCGSVPPGLPLDLYARIGHEARLHRVRFVPDCDGDSLRLASPYADLLVPNVHEAERLLGIRIHDVADAGQAALRLVQLGPSLAAITMGPDGAVLSDGTHTWHAAAPPCNQGSAVGAGDAFLAALLVEIEKETAIDLALRHAVSAGAAALNSQGSDLLTPEETRQQLEKTEARLLH